MCSREPLGDVVRIEMYALFIIIFIIIFIQNSFIITIGFINIYYYCYHYLEFYTVLKENREKIALTAKWK